MRNEEGSTIGDGTDTEFSCKKDLVGQTLKVTEIHDTRITVEGGWYVPYGALEKVQEPTFADKHKKWMDDNKVAIGTRVRITRAFSNYEEGCGIIGWYDSMSTYVGKEATVIEINNDHCDLRVVVGENESAWFPHTCLEVIKEPTYKERQAEWVLKNNVKAGTKVRFTRGFGDDEDGSYSCRHKDAKGHEGIVQSTESKTIWVKVSSLPVTDLWACPYTALELVPEEPWFKIGDKVRITIKSFLKRTTR